MCAHNLYIGSTRALSNIGVLTQDYGITHVIVCNSEASSGLFEFLAIHLGLSNHASMLDSSFKFMQSSILQKGKVLVCCETGLVWAPLVVANYLLRFLGFGPQFIINEFYLPAGINISEESAIYLCEIVKAYPVSPTRYFFDSRETYQCLCGSCVLFISDEYLNTSGYYDHEMVAFLEGDSYQQHSRLMEHDSSYEAYLDLMVFKWLHVEEKFVEKRLGKTEIITFPTMKEWTFTRCASCKFYTYASWTKSRFAFNTSLRCEGVVWDRRPASFHRNRYQLST
eukprot:TRINITY_DN11952_c0_g1_i3.p1 TRINITY_DN11952_c0_g1~~TRINITY_DN11952_c0_g1_i3.p1  ORF type:complete len:282 (-),score=32.84 TRINITY_DN11952_c0_g1_i3:160-1005(-)